jgi:predicted dehydrogenase
MIPLRVGVIGYGYTGRIHADAYSRCRDAQLVAIADTDKQRLMDLPRGVQGHTAYLNLLDSDIEAVSICLPTHLHCPVAIEALSRGKHVLVEKPIAMDLDESRRMMQAADAAGRILYVGMTHRFYPEVREAKQRLDDGAIGTIVACNDCALEHLGFLSLPPWYMQKRFAGGGTVLTSGIHLVDRVRWFMGDEVCQVAGAAGNPYFGADVEDAGQMFLRFRNGVSAQITMAFMREPHPLVCDLQLIGTRGSITVHTWRGYELWNERGQEERIFYKEEPHRDKVLAGVAGEVAEFCGAIAEERVPWPSARESTAALEVVMAYYRAAASGEPVPLGGLHAD